MFVQCCITSSTALDRNFFQSFTQAIKTSSLILFTRENPVKIYGPKDLGSMRHSSGTSITLGLRHRGRETHESK